MAEKIETVNQYLADNFGIDTDDGEPIFRIVFSDDQFEKRQTKFTDSGIELLEPEVRMLPKYPWINGMYVLERRVIVPEVNIKELAAAKKSYEPVWVFQGANGFPVPPTIQGCKLIVDVLYAALGKKSLAKYKDEQASVKNAHEAYEANKSQIDKLENELFGDESGLNQQTINASGSGIIVPQNYKGVN
jgi:hypothetical protein